MLFKVGDTIKMNFTNQKTKVITPGFGFVLGFEKLAEDINSYHIFFYKKGDLYNFRTSSYSGSFFSSRIVLLEKFKQIKKEPFNEGMNLIRDINY